MSGCRIRIRYRHAGAVLVVLGDLTAVDRELSAGLVVLAEPGAALGEVLASQVPRLVAHAAADILVFPGLADPRVRQFIGQ